MQQVVLPLSVFCVFLEVPLVGLKSAIVVFSAHTYLLLYFSFNKDNILMELQGCAGCFVPFFFSRVTKSGFVDIIHLPILNIKF